jgi:hypothetical protein
VTNTATFSRPMAGAYLRDYSLERLNLLVVAPSVCSWGGSDMPMEMHSKVSGGAES